VRELGGASDRKEISQVAAIVATQSVRPDLNLGRGPAPRNPPADTERAAWMRVSRVCSG